MTCDETAERAKAKLMQLRQGEPIDSEWFENRSEAEAFLSAVAKVGDGDAGK